MGFLLLCSRKRSLASDIMSHNPNKKIKLEFQNERNTGNDDLWGQDDDITAEEFDLLEIQATQSCNQNCNLLNNTLQTANLLPKSSNSELYDLKQLQYELEGRVKLLSLSLEKSAKELSEERLNRERLINERIKQFHEREITLRKEVEKMQSILEFKEQEMKSTYSKLQVLKSQHQDKKDIKNDMPVNSNFEDFLKCSKSYGQSVKHSNASPKQYRKCKLSTDMPRGEVNGTEILSSILCSRLAIPSLTNSAYMFDSSGRLNLTPITVLQIKNDQKCDEILKYYSNFLENHVNLLKTLVSKNNQGHSNKSTLSTRPKEAFCSQTIVSYLTDITCIYSSPSFKSHDKNYIKSENPSKNMHHQKSERESLSCDQQNENLPVSDNTLSLLESLIALSNPKTYPIHYHKNEEMELALSALLSICLSCSKVFLDSVCELPTYFFSRPHESIAGLCTTIKLLIALCPNKGFLSHLTHKENNCIFCFIAALLCIEVPANPEKFALPLILVEDFLSSVFAVHNYKEIQLTSNCISQVTQGIIKSLWKYFQIGEKDALSFQILKKGFSLLHFISSNIPNFKENRNAVEDEYVSFISGILAISKENSELRDLYDLIHTLWDFQTDMSEFDLDDLSEETPACTNEIDNE